MAADGHTYENEAIKAWLAGHSTSPVTGKPLRHQQLVRNHNLRQAIQRFLEATPPPINPPSH